MELPFPQCRRSVGMLGSRGRSATKTRILHYMSVAIVTLVGSFQAGRLRGGE